MSRELFFIISITLWAVVYFFLNMLRMNFFKFIWGSVGIFTICMIFFMEPIEVFINSLNTAVLGIVAQRINIFQVYPANQSIAINTFDGIVSILINYECSGVIELLAFAALHFFFPFGGRIIKYLNMLWGLIFIFGANILRILLIIVITKSFGISSYYLSHTLFARLFFFALMVVIYYRTFTKVHIKYQKIGD